MSRIRRIARCAAWAAVYALVLNVVMTSALQAAVSPLKFNALHELCLNAGSAAPSGKDDGEPGKPIIHCPLCLSGVTALDVPPQSPALAIRIALHVAFEPARPDTIVPRAITNAHSARGPPRLG